MVFKNLFRRKGRTILTLLGIAIGVAAMVALGALGAGMASGYQAMAAGSQADLVLSQPGAFDLTMSAVEEHVGDELLAMPEVRQVAGTIMGNVSAQGGAKYFCTSSASAVGSAGREPRRCWSWWAWATACGICPPPSPVASVSGWP